MYIKIPSTYKVILFVFVPRVGTTTLTIISNGNQSSAEKIRLKFAYIRMKRKNKQTNERKIYISTIAWNWLVCSFFFQISFDCSNCDASAVAGAAFHLFRLKFFDVFILWCPSFFTEFPEDGHSFNVFDKCVKIDICIGTRICVLNISISSAFSRSAGIVHLLFLTTDSHT